MENDRISSLPDDILLHIISFLYSRCAIRTGVLSKRWQFLWTKSRSIRIKEKHCWPASVSTTQDRIMSRRRFNSAIDAILESLTTTHLEVFYVSFRFSHSGKEPKDLIREQQEYIDRWIHHLTMTKNVKDLSIRFPICTTKVLFHLPPCKSITRLRLHGVPVISSNNFEAFPLINDLYLLHCSLSPDWVKNLSSCPSLEKCTIRDCYLEGDVCLSAPWLKVLKIRIDSFRDAHMHAVCLEIDAPNLQNLHIGFREGVHIRLRNMRSLIALKLDGSFGVHQPSYFIPQLMPALCCVKKLQINPFFILAFFKWRNESGGLFVGQLQSLEHLILGMFGYPEEVPAVASLLDLAPNAEKLTIRYLRGSHVEDGEFERFDDLCYKSLKNLKMIHVGISGDCRTSGDCRLVKFLLKWASSLELLKVSHPFWKMQNESTKLALERKFLAMQRGGTPKICFTDVYSEF